MSWVIQFVLTHHQTPLYTAFLPEELFRNRKAKISGSVCPNCTDHFHDRVWALRSSHLKQMVTSGHEFPFRIDPFVRGIHRSPVDSHHKGPVMQGYDVIFTVSLNTSGQMNKVTVCYIPLTQDCNLCASLVRPQSWSGRRWRRKVGRKFALVVRGCHRGRSDLATDTVVAVKFWACPNSRTNVAEEVGCSQVAHRRQEEGTHIAVVAEWMHRGRP